KAFVIGFIDNRKSSIRQNLGLILDDPKYMGKRSSREEIFGSPLDSDNGEDYDQCMDTAGKDRFSKSTIEHSSDEEESESDRNTGENRSEPEHEHDEENNGVSSASDISESEEDVSLFCFF